MRGEIQRAIELCLEAREHFDAGDLAMRLDTGMTLGYEYFMAGDYDNASPILHETIRSAERPVPSSTPWPHTVSWRGWSACRAC